ncbi:MAG: 1,4-dihydroxy-2-naphthoate octaprenyltransferase [Verrucomicrobiales bacterium]|nr:1,4-dihydroxy-2-naphthoate octaprenyltransferase [Verrucomicrobiales bacterium]
MKAWILAARPKTLPAAVIPVWVGAMPRLLDGDPGSGSWILFWCTLASCLGIQIATNLFNDAIDHKKGADTGDRLGPTRVTASGLLSSRAVMRGALGFCVLAALISLPMVLERGWPVVAIGLVSIYFAYGYTGGPFPLAYRGMGELFVILFFGFVAVLGSYFVQSGELGGGAIWILGLQCGFYSCVLIAINNLRDIEEDRQTEKKTLAVRFGKTFARWEIALFCFVPVLLQWYSLGWAMPEGLFSRIAFGAGIGAGVVIVRSVIQFEPSQRYNRFLALGALQLLLFGLTVSLIAAGK